MVECGGLENRLSGVPGYEGSNPSSSAIFYLTSKYTTWPRAPFCTVQEGFEPAGPQNGGRPAPAGEMPGMKPTPYLFGRRAGILYQYPADSIGGRHIRERASPGME